MEIQNLLNTAKAILRQVYSNTSLLQETRKSQINNLTPHLKELPKGKHKSKVSRRKEK